VPWDITAIILVVGLMLFYYTGVVASDDLGYLRVWENFPTPPAAGPLGCDWYFPCRFVHWIPLTLATAILPNHPWAMGAASLVGAIVLLLTIRSFARRHLGLGEIPTAGAVLAFGLMPTMVLSSSVALPDLTAAVLAWLGISVVAPALLEREARHAVLRCLAGGFLIAVGYNAKESTLALVAGLGLFVLLCRTRCAWAWWRSLLLVSGAGLWLGIETLVLWIVTGRPLAHLEAVRAAHRACHNPNVQMTITGLLSYWTDYVRWLADAGSDYGLTGPVTLVAAVAVVVWRRAAGYLLLCVLLPVSVYLSVGSVEWKQYVPIFHQSHYLVVVLPALALMVGMMLQHLQGTFARSTRWMVPAMIVICALSFTGPDRMANKWSNAKTFAAGYELISGCEALSEPSARLVAAGLTRNRFACLPRWLDCPQVELALPAPTTREEWVRRYGGAYVITTRFDRVGDGLAKHDRLTLMGPSMAALSTFERIARREPYRDRSSRTWAHITGQPAPTVPGLAVELWRVPKSLHEPPPPASGGVQSATTATRADVASPY